MKMRMMESLKGELTVKRDTEPAETPMDIE